MTTASEETAREAEAEAEVPDALPESLRRQVRTCATSVPLPPPAAPGTVTLRARAAGRAAARIAEQAPARAAGYLDRPGSLVYAQPPTFARAREQHHEAAARHSAPVLRCLRLAWGYLHLLLLKPVLNGLEWATENPARFTVAAVVAFIVWFWS